MSSKTQIPTWKIGFAVLGALIWMLSLTTAEYIKSQGWLDLYKLVSGYVLGFLIAFSGFVFKEVWQGRADQFLDPHPVLRVMSYALLVFVILLGGLALAAEIFGNTDKFYNIGSLLGASVVGGGILPVANKLDKQRTNKE